MGLRQLRDDFTTAYRWQGRCLMFAGEEAISQLPQFVLTRSWFALPEV